MKYNHKTMPRIFLSPPHLEGQEFDFVKQAFESNYIAPLGPQVNNFEAEFAEVVGTKHTLALSSGTAALHLGMRYLDVGPEDEVVCSSLTFAASSNAILYLNAHPVFIDSDQNSWNMDPNLLEDLFSRRAKSGKLPKAVMLVHIYGQAADLDAINGLCDQYGVELIEDAAESLGAKYKGRVPGTIGKCGAYSFNGNKIITTSGGGMLVSDDEALIKKARFWATQARDPATHYEHSEMGYNYRMSNILAGIGRGQLRALNTRVEQKRTLFKRYVDELQNMPGISFMPEPEWSRSTRWLTCLTINPRLAGTNRDKVITELEKENIESRPTWKPMHLQPLYKNNEMIGGKVCEELFEKGICLPSGTAMTDEDFNRIISAIKNCWQ